MTATSGAGKGWDRYYGGLLLTRRLGAFDVSVLDRLRRAREAAESSPGEPLDLDALAGVACFSKFHFLRLFRQAYGETPLRYLARLRLERARLLLEETERSVTEIGIEVGYGTPASFSAAFRKHLGVAPQRYRRRWVSVPRVLPEAPRIPGCFVAMYA